MDNKLSLQDLASIMAESYGLDIKSSHAFVKTVFEIVEEFVAKDKLVKVKGFGTFKLVNVSDRESINVNTGERIVIAGHTKLTFTPDSVLKDTVNRPFADFETTLLSESISIEEMEKIPVQMEDEVTDSISKSVMSQEVVAGSIIEDSKQKNTREILNEAETLDSDIMDGQEDSALHVHEFNTEEDDGIVDVEVEASVVSGKVQETDVPIEVQEKNEVAPVIVFDSKSSERKVNGDNPSYPMSSEPLDMTVVDRKCKSYRWGYVLLTVIFMALSYFAGHYRLFEKIDFNTYPEASETGVSVPTDETPESYTDTPIVVEQDSIANDTLSADTVLPSQNAVANQQQTVVGEDPAEIAKYFPQVPGGEYWIVGDAGYVHQMQVGETLYRIARKELGDQNLVRYLIVFNKFEDPNIIHTGDPIRIPKLVKKDISTN
jgi:nucleoid DNA-binding protein